MTLDDLQKLCDAATPGPWNFCQADAGGRERWLLSGGEVGDLRGGDDAALIAAARTYLPRLIAVAKIGEGFADLWDELIDDGDGTFSVQKEVAAKAAREAYRVALAALEAP